MSPITHCSTYGLQPDSYVISQCPEQLQETLKPIATSVFWRDSRRRWMVVEAAFIMGPMLFWPNDQKSCAVWLMGTYMTKTSAMCSWNWSISNGQFESITGKNVLSVVNGPTNATDAISKVSQMSYQKVRNNFFAFQEQIYRILENDLKNIYLLNFKLNSHQTILLFYFLHLWMRKICKKMYITYCIASIRSIIVAW